MKISDLDFLRLLPAFMRDDEAVVALSKAMNHLLGEPGARLSTIRTWDKIDELTEAECDELAWELDIDWYDSTGMGLDEKRETIKLAQQIKRKRGTKWAVERLISAYFGEGYVVEWYEQEIIKKAAAPYTFSVLTTNPDISGNYTKFVEAANAAKNARSHLAGVYYLWQMNDPDYGIEYSLNTGLHRYDYTKCGTRDRAGTVGFMVRPAVEAEPEESRHLYGFTQAGAKTCGAYQWESTQCASLKAEAVAKPETAHAVYEFPKCGTQVCDAGAVDMRNNAMLGKAILGQAILGQSFAGK